MANVQFVDTLDCGDRFDVVVMQTVTGVDDQALGQTKRHTIGHTLKLFSHFCRRLGIGVTTGVQFNGWRTYAFGGCNLPFVGIDEQRHFTADFRQTIHRRLDPCFLPRDIQAAFGGQLLTGFRDQANVCRADALGERHHFFGDAHFEIHAGLQDILEQQHVALLDVPTVFAQMHGDAVSARLFRIQCCLDRIRIASAPGLTQGGDVVDVHAKKNAIAGGHGSAPEEGKVRCTAYTRR